MKILGGPQRLVKMVNINVMTQAEDNGSSCLTEHDSQQFEAIREEENHQLLPGILDHITINHIAPKLPWTAYYVLSLVSRGWQKAIQSHQIYEARVRSQCTQTLVVVHLKFVVEGNNCISVSSSEDGLCWHLPPIPGFQSGFPAPVKCVSMDCKLYVIGGFKKRQPIPYSEDGAEVYVFDLAGQRQWKQLASMRYWTTGFGCGVMNGKIYVFGGMSVNDPVHASEVYDPEENAWSPVAPMISFRAFHKVTAVGEELVMHSGLAIHPDFIERRRRRPNLNGLTWDASSSDIYHTVKDEWRFVEHFTTEPDLNCDLNFVVAMRGKLHRVTQRGIDIYDTQANSWEPLHSFSWTDSFSVDGLYAVVPVENDEILLVVDWQNKNERHREPSSRICLLKSRGCGDKNKEVEWQKLECSLPLENLSNPFFLFCPIQV